MTNIQQGNENLKILQVIEDAHVTLSTVPQKTEVPVTSSSHSSNLAAKFLNLSDIPLTDAKIVSPLDVHVHHEVPIFQFNTRVTTLEKEVAELKKDDPLKTQVTALVDEHLDTRLGATRYEFMNFLSVSITARITKQVKSQLPQILLKEVYNFAPPAAAMLTEFELRKILINKIDKSESYLGAPEHKECYEGLKKSYALDKTIFSTYGKVYSLKKSRKDKDKDPFARSDRGLKKRKTSKDAEPTNVLKAKESQAGSSKGDKSQSKSSRKSVQLEELELEVADSDMPQDQKEYPGGYYPFDLTKPLPLVTSGNHEKVHVDYFFNNDLKDLQGKVSIMTYTTSITKTKDALYDLPGIEDMVPNIWVPVKVAYDKHVLWGISYWREQRKTFYGYAQGLQSKHNVYFTKRILVVTQVKVMRKHVYRYLQEIVVRRANNDLYRFKKGDFLCLRINDIEDMLLLVVQNWLTNLSGDDVFDFTIALRMLTRSLVIQKRVKDPQLKVKSYQKKINVTKPETTKSEIRKRAPYTPYQDHQGFIYVNDNRKNRVIRDLPRDIPLDSVEVLRCAAFEEVASLKEPFNLEKMSGYHSSSKKEFDQAITSYPFIVGATSDSYTSLKELLSKKPKSLRMKLTSSDSKPSSSRALSMATTRNHAPPGAIDNGPAMLTPYWKKGHAKVIGVISFVGFLANSASYSASLLVVSNSNLRAKTALILSSEAARYIAKASPLIGAIIVGNVSRNSFIFRRPPMPLLSTKLPSYSSEIGFAFTILRPMVRNLELIGTEIMQETTKKIIQIKERLKTTRDRQKRYHASIKCAPFEALYGQKCRSPMMWAEFGVDWYRNYARDH
nr:hypothetical protein [Tanacetum cinerariifolium]